MIKNLNILFLEEDHSFIKTVSEMLCEEDIISDIVTAENENDIVNFLKQVKFDVILADYYHSMDGEKALKIAMELAPDTIFIFLSENLSEEKIVKLLKMGAVDYILKTQINRLTLTILRALLEKEENKKLQVTQQELKESEDRFQKLVESIPDIVYRIDAKGYFTFVNQAIRKLGYDPDELIGKHFQEIIVDEDYDTVSREKVLPKYKNVVTGADKAPKLFDERRGGNRLTKNLQIRLKPKNKNTVLLPEELHGEVFASGDYSSIDLNYYTWVEISAQGQYETDIIRSDMNFIGTVGVIRDVSERRKLDLKEKEIIKNLEFLSKSAMDLLNAQSINEVMDYAGQKLSGMLKNAIVVVNTVVEKTQSIVLHKILGQNISSAGFNPTGKVYQLKNEVKMNLSEGKLKQFENIDGIIESGNQNNIFKFLDENYKIHTIYSIGMMDQNQIIGVIFFFIISPLEAVNQELIETFVNQVSIAYQSKRANAALAQLNQNLEKRVKEAIAEIRNKDQMMINQSR
jgi:PAS domain S-box-containing protein